MTQESMRESTMDLLMILERHSDQSRWALEQCEKLLVDMLHGKQPERQRVVSLLNDVVKLAIRGKKPLGYPDRVTRAAE